MQERVGVFPGSFDPFTIGHESIVRRALPLFDKIIVAVGINSDKKSFYSLEQRINWIQTIFAGETKVNVDVYQELTVHYCERIHAKFLIRGLRTSSDFEYERVIAHMNKMMLPHLETVFLLTDQNQSAVSSTVVREIIKHGGDASKFVPDVIASDFKR